MTECSDNCSYWTTACCDCSQKVVCHRRNAVVEGRALLDRELDTAEECASFAPALSSMLTNFAEAVRSVREDHQQLARWSQ